MHFARLLVLVATMVPGLATAGSFRVPSFRTLDEGGKVRVLPHREDLAFGRAFAAFRGGALSFDDTMRRLLATKTGFAVAARSLSATKIASRSYQFFVGDVPVCGYQVRVSELPGRQVLALGKAPTVNTVVSTPPADWPRQEPAFAVAAATLASIIQEGGDVTAALADRCYVVRDGALLPAWRFQLVAAGMPYVAIADAASTFQLDRQFFEVDGKATVYAENQVATPTLSETLLPGLIGDQLETEFLKTAVPSPYTRASEASHDFTYPPTDDRFGEVSSFAHAVAHYKFFQDLGFEYYDATKPLIIEVHKPPGGKTNNALFTPAIAGSAPRITIGDGDGLTLDNLALDGDVVSHELGHFILFQYVTTTTGPSLVLHEGLADFMAFSRAGNACLGESICPAGSGACVLEGECLRSGDLDVKYNDELWKDWAGPTNKLGHLHGQVISGLLWDLKKSSAVPLAVLNQTVMKAMTHLPETSSFSDFVDALLVASNEVSGPQYDAAIRAAVTSRGLAEFLDVEDPGTIVEPEPAAPAPVPEPAPLPVEEDDDEPKKKKPKVLGVSCGVVKQEGKEKAPDYAGALGFLILVLPVAVLLTSARASSSRGRKG